MARFLALLTAFFLVSAPMRAEAGVLEWCRRTFWGAATGEMPAFEPLKAGQSGLDRKALRDILGGGEFQERYRRARTHVVGLEGSSERRAQVLFDLFTELKASTGGWFFSHYRTADGSYAFQAAALPILLLVRESDGAVFRTTPPAVKGETWTPDYADTTNFTRINP